MSPRRSDSFDWDRAFQEASFSGRLALLLSSWFCIGRIPWAPGTLGTLGAIPLVVIGQWWSGFCAGLFLLAFILIAFFVSHKSSVILGANDPSSVVIDEVAGFLVALYLLPITWMTLAAGFILFRLFDIWKPGIIRKVEVFRGGIGIVLDDLMAGVLTNLIIRLGLGIWGFH
jgi:phosphatidylglycerophosphatase A